MSYNEERIEYYRNKTINVKNIEVIDKSLNVRSSRSSKYWKARGFDDVDSDILSKSRMPGQYEYYRIFKNMSRDESIEEVERYSKTVAVTLDNMIAKHGHDIGIKKWNDYCAKQAKSNSYEYKKEKHSWSETEYDKFNKSRSVTLEHMIDKHGEEIGIVKWNEYCERQRYTNTIEYFIEKYGEDVGPEKYKNINKLKSHTLESYVNRYGSYDMGKDKYINYLSNNNNNIYSSKKSNDFFMKIIFKMQIQAEPGLYVSFINGEYGVFLEESRRYTFVDFLYNGKVIEFYGNYWHANPRIYDENHVMSYPRRKVNASEIRNYDNIRVSQLRNVKRIKDILIIWEDEYDDFPDESIKKCIKYLKG